MTCLDVHSEVAAALAEAQPVVALESTLIAQGLPWPENLRTARESEAAIRAAGALPATIAVFGGRIRVGLTDSELEHLARSSTFAKAGRRDLSTFVARGGNAATTVSATLWIARRVGIGVMATGGLGGVHRDAASSFDVSTDLDELARADGVLVVCSGAKILLDLPATLEALETRGVTVVGYGTDTFPAFTVADSGLLLGTRVDSPRDAAAIVLVHRDLDLPGAVILAQPVPMEEALDAQVAESVLQTALAEGVARGITGKEVTPFLLEAMRGETGGASLRANQALIRANADLAARVAIALTRGT